MEQEIPANMKRFLRIIIFCKVAGTAAFISAERAG